MSPTLLSKQPTFCVTSDADWASEFCVETWLRFLAEAGVRSTFFATHKSQALDRAHDRGEVEVGVHPNFLPGSTHGSTISTVLEHVFSLYPDARCFRSHAFFDTSSVTTALRARGIRYDSNLCLYLQEGLVPLQHASGITRFPVFWEDDAHWLRSSGDWALEEWLPHFLTPGLKVINVHAFNFALNVPNDTFYGSVKSRIPSLTESQAKTARHGGAGTETFVRALIARLVEAGHRFYTLGELFEQWETP